MGGCKISDVFLNYSYRLSLKPMVYCAVRYMNRNAHHAWDSKVHPIIKLKTWRECNVLIYQKEPLVAVYKFFFIYSP